jgi:hypothetical protein
MTAPRSSREFLSAFEFLIGQIEIKQVEDVLTDRFPGNRSFAADAWILNATTSG